MQINIRRVEKKDRFAIRAMVFRALLNPLNLDWRQFVVAESDGRMIEIRQVRSWEKYFN